MKPTVVAVIHSHTPRGHPIELSITDEFLHDILITAFDPGYGGSLYWGRIKRDPRGVSRPRAPPSINKMWKLAYEGESFEIEVVGDFPEEPPEIVELTRQKLVNGIEKWFEFIMSRESTRKHIAMMLQTRTPDDWDLDAEDTDAIVQFAVFGELTFG